MTDCPTCGAHPLQSCDCPVVSHHCRTTHSACDCILRRLKLLEAVADAARHIPEQPSAAHRLRTPGWNELQKALTALNEAISL